mmetsp:Transcript_37805/g.95036  ORF Transcript_37805/g.95036 Transcript_37805/m.95036 type:complete len:89 (+) Transcript_37805:175-441(+)
MHTTKHSASETTFHSAGVFKRKHLQTATEADCNMGSVFLKKEVARTRSAPPIHLPSSRPQEQPHTGNSLSLQRALRDIQRFRAGAAAL